MKRSDHRSFLGNFSKGCRKCAKGAKMVLLVTGLCPRSCYYCPLSSEKYKKDVVYANELRVESDEEILLEAKQMRALGTGITGGDPLLVPERTNRLIRLLKETFGPNHHIHLYTTGEVEPPLIAELANSGLDEIRFHPPPQEWTSEKPAFLPAFNQALWTNMDVGIEIPIIPGMHKEIELLALRCFSMGMDFLNLNELEVSETNWEALRKQGFQIKGDTSAIKGSLETGKKVLKRLDKQGFNVNLCTAKFKDAVQLRRRLLRRAETIKKPYQLITDDSTLYFGIVEPARTDPKEFREQMLAFLKEYKVPRSLYRFTDTALEIAPWVLQELSSNIPFKTFLVEVYPSADALEVERSPLK